MLRLIPILLAVFSLTTAGAVAQGGIGGQPTTEYGCCCQPAILFTNNPSCDSRCQPTASCDVDPEAPNSFPGKCRETESAKNGGAAAYTCTSGGSKTFKDVPIYSCGGPIDCIPASMGEACYSEESGSFGPDQTVDQCSGGECPVAPGQTDDNGIKVNTTICN